MISAPIDVHVRVIDTGELAAVENIVELQLPFESSDSILQTKIAEPCVFRLGGHVCIVILHRNIDGKTSAWKEVEIKATGILPDSGRNSSQFFR